MTSVLITGADRGLGYALMEKCLEKGYQVYACLHNQPNQAILALKENHAERLIPIQMDVADGASVEGAVEAVEKNTDSLDIVINNAGVHLENTCDALEDTDLDMALTTYNVNALGPLRVTKGFLPLVEQGRKKMIVNISSEAGSISDCWRDREYGYCMSKAALNMQSVILQKYVKGRGIKVLAIHPGWMRTGMGGPDAHIEACTAAEGILKLIEQYEGDLNGPIYMDYTGKILKW